MEDKHNTKNALGTEIVIGNFYGYSVDNNGHTHTVIGKAIRFTASGKLTLEVVSSQSSLWMDEVEDNRWLTAKKVSVKPAKCFPVDMDSGECERPEDIEIETDDRYSMRSQWKIGICNLLNRVDFSHETQQFGTDDVQVFPEDLPQIIEYLKKAEKYMKTK